MKTGRRKSDVIFLLGAGASVEAGVHTSNKITDILINFGSYCPSENSTAIENLLKYIQVRIADYSQVKASEVNFEYIRIKGDVRAERA
jgi:NAD-dependent SIR2 family protein deacetylase